jgi:predicted ATP-grasp superfamily ATP-dependent carboligase
VTDAEERSSLAACRGLARAGYRVTAAARVRPASSHWSRAPERRVVLPDPRVDPEAFLSGLEEFLRRERHAILLPSSDLSLWLISEQRERFEGLVRLPFADREAVRASVDKTRLVEEARTAGLAAPSSATCGDAAAALAASRSLGFPLVLKGSRSFVPSGRRFAPRPVALVRTEAELVRAAPEFGSPFVVQRYEAGREVVSCAGLMVGGRLVAVAVVRWQRRWPVETGAASFCESIVPPPGLAPKVEALLAGLRFQGIFELEMLDLGAGRYAAIDLNPRLFGWLALPVENGANLPAMLCDWLRGVEPAPVEVRAGARYRWEDGDLRHLAWQLRHGHLRAAAAVLRPRAGVTHAHFQMRDPGPLLARAGLVARLWLRRQRARVTNGRGPDREGPIGLGERVAE